MNLARHPHGAPVLEALYVRLPGSKRPALLAEFYGKEFTLFRNTQRSTGGAVPPARLADACAGDERRKRVACRWNLPGRPGLPRPALALAALMPSLCSTRAKPRRKPGKPGQNPGKTRENPGKTRAASAG